MSNLDKDYSELAKAAMDRVKNMSANKKLQHQQVTIHELGQQALLYRQYYEVEKTKNQKCNCTSASGKKKPRLEEIEQLKAELSKTQDELSKTRETHESEMTRLYMVQKCKDLTQKATESEASGKGNEFSVVQKELKSLQASFTEYKFDSEFRVKKLESENLKYEEEIKLAKESRPDSTTGVDVETYKDALSEGSKLAKLLNEEKIKRLDLATEGVQLTKSNSSLRLRVEAVKKEREQAMKDKMTAETAVESYKKHLAKACSEREQFRSLNYVNEDELKKLQENVVTIEKDLEKMKEGKLCVQNELNDKHQKYLQLNDAFTTQDNTINDLNKRILELEKFIEESKQNSNEEKDKEACKRYDDLLEKFNAKVMENKELIAQVDTSKTQVRQLQTGNFDLDRKLLESINSTAEDNIKLGELEKNLELAKAEISKLVTNVKQLMAENEVLSNTAKESQVKLSALKDKEVNLSDTKDSEVKLSEANEIIKDLETRLNNEEKRFKDANAMGQTWKRLAERATLKVRHMPPIAADEQVKSLQATVDKLQLQLTDLECQLQKEIMSKNRRKKS